MATGDVAGMADTELRNRGDVAQLKMMQELCRDIRGRVAAEDDLWTAVGLRSVLHASQIDAYADN